MKKTLAVFSIVSVIIAIVFWYIYGRYLTYEMFFCGNDGCGYSYNEEFSTPFRIFITLIVGALCGTLATYVYKKLHKKF
ncbi:MAG: hypothetical protein V4519_00080 [Patescibacteria group bacterium]